MQKLLVSLLIMIVVISLLQPTVFAHRSGCHRWHSCPSDTGSYTCGDLGYDSECPKKEQPQKQTPSKQTEPTKTQTKSYTGQSKPDGKCGGKALCIIGKVQRIIDGDTLVVDSYKIRLSLTNTPEKSENGFKEATSFTSKLCPAGSTVTVDQDDKQPTDKYKRIVGKVFCSEKILNAELLYNGHANILTKYCSKSEFASESWAKRFGC